RADRGYNALIMELVEMTHATNAPTNYYGDRPFTGATFATPNEAYFTHVDYVLSRAAAYGITVFLFPAYTGYGCVNSDGWCTEMQKAPDSVMSNWGTYVGNRWKYYPNIVWVMGGDADPNIFSVRGKINAVAKAIRSQDPVHEMTAHNVRGES